MPKGSNQKYKLYRLAKIMQGETDETHGLTMEQIREKLEAYDITADRKTLYDDLAALEVLGLVVDKEREGRNYLYYVSEKQFEMAELKLLVDAIQSSKFITLKKSNALIAKLTNFVSRYEAMQLDRQVYVSGRVKTMNESIYYNVDAIYNAIADNCKISFEYLKWNLKKELVPRRDSEYIVSPWGLSWEDENYYLIAYDSNAEKIKHYRVDKMRKIRMRKERRDGKAFFEQFDMASYTNKSFGMFGGIEENVVLRFDNALIGVMLDRFGKEIMIYPVDDTHSKTIVDVVVSEQFFGWIFGLGGKVVIESPESVAADYRKEMEKQMKEYR